MFIGTNGCKMTLLKTTMLMTTLGGVSSSSVESWSHPLVRTVASIGSETAAAGEDGREAVRLGMPRGYISSSSECALNWERRGWDTDIVFALAEHTGNARGCVQVGRDQVFPNGSLAGGMLDLALGHVDLHGKARYPEVALGKVVDFLYPHRQENLCIIVRRKSLSAHMALPSVSASIWVLTVTFLGLFWAGLVFGYREPPQRAVLEVARTFIAGMFANTQRRLMVWLSVFSFVVMNSFSGSLVGSLVAPDQEAQVDTLAEVNAMYDVVYSTKVTAEAMVNIGAEEDPVAYALARKVRPLGQAQWPQAIKDAASGSTPAAVLSTETGLDIFRGYPDASDGGVPLFHKVRECVLSPAFYAFPVRTGWALRERWSDLLQRLVEGGLVEKWCAGSLARIAREANGTGAASQRAPPSGSAHQPFSLVNLAPLLVAWGGGAVVALGLFLAERCCFCCLGGCAGGGCCQGQN